MRECVHFKQAKPGIQPRSEECEDCLRKGTPWVQLRVCLVCGNVGCCDSSPGKHATAHFNKTKHPVMQAKGRAWKWCYVHKQYF